MWTFLKSATDESNWLKGHQKEICFIGRSNVGKSSLINALAKQKIAKTSNTPGRTQLINFFQNNNQIIVDLPGYGYAKMSKTMKHKIFLMVEEYLQNRDELKCVFILIDAKIGPTKDDLIITDFLKNSEKNFFIILTKSDKAKQSEIYKTKQKMKLLTNDFIIVSSLKRINIKLLQKIIIKTFKG